MPSPSRRRTAAPARTAKPPRRLAVEALEDRVTPAVSLTINDRTLAAPAVAQSVAGTLNPGSAADVYRFTGLAGDRLTFDWLSDAAAGSWSLADPGGRGLFAVGFGTDQTVTLPAAGDYTLVVAGASADPVPYSFAVQDTQEPDAAVGGPFNTAQSGTATTAGTTFTFTAPAGRLVYLDAYQANSTGVRYTLTGPGGAVVDTTIGDNNAGVGPFQLARAGTYTLTAKTATGTAPYAFNLLDLDGGGAAPIAYGAVADGAYPDAAGTAWFRVQAAAGQRPVFDGYYQGGGPAGELYGPGGVGNGYSLSAEYDRLSLTPLAATGTYYLRLGDGWATGSGTGRYGFKLLDAAAAPVLSFAADTAGTLTPDSGLAVYRFTATAGERLAFDWADPVGLVSAVVYGPNETFFSSPYQAADAVFYAQATGTHYLYIVGTGTGGAGSSQAYQLRAYRGPTSTTAYTIGTTVSGNLSTPGQIDRYTFAGTAGQRLVYDSLGVDPGTSLWLTGPSGATVPTIGLGAQDSWPATLTETGTYTLRVLRDDVSTTLGAYTFRLLDVAAASALTFGSETTGTLTPGDSVKLYKFDITPADLAAGGGGVRVSFRGTAGSGYGTLYAPNNYYPVTFSLDGANGPSYAITRLTQPGTYVFVVAGNAAGANPFAFTAAKPATTTTAYTVGNTVSGTLGALGEVDRYTFTGSVGQRLVFDALGGGGDYALVRLIGPGGNDVTGDWGYGVNDGGPKTLTLAGTYALEVYRSEPADVAYRFRLLDVAAASTLAFGSETTGSLDAGGTGLGAKLYKFDVTAANLTAGGGKVRVSVRMTDGSADAYLYGPAGEYLAYSGISSYFQRDLTYPGTYVLAVYGSAEATGNTFALTAAKPAVTTTAYTLGTTVTGSVGVFGEVDRYTFTGAAGQRVLFDALDGANFNRARLLGPTGADVSGDWYYANYDSGPKTLTRAGTYTLEVYQDAPGDGAYSFRLLDAAGATALAPTAAGATTSGTLSPGNAARLYKLDVSAADVAGGPLKVSFRRTDGQFVGTLYGPTNLAVGTFTDAATFALAHPGTYLLALYGDSTEASVPFAFVAAKPGTSTAAYTLGTRANGSLGAVGEVDRFTFTGAVGQRLVFDGLGASDARVRLVAPSGVVVTEAAVAEAAGWGVRTLPEAGTYALELFADDAVGGAYSFRVIDTAASPAKALATGANTATLSPGDGAAVFRFTATAGQTLSITNFTAGDTAGSYAVYGPLGQSVGGAAFDAGNADLFLPAAGGYVLALFGSGGDLDNAVSFTATITTPTATAVSGFNALQTAALAVGGSTSFSYAAPAGRVVLFNDVSGNAAEVRYTLTGPTGVVFDVYSTYGFPVVLPASGSYTLTATNDLGDGPRDVAFRLLDLDGAGATAYAVGTTATGTFAATGEAKAYRLTGTQGRRLVYDGIDAGAYGTAALHGPGADLPYAGLYDQFLLTGVGSDSQPVVLAADGTYYLVLVNYLDPADFSFRVLDAGAAPALSFAADTAGTLDPASSAAAYRFTGTAGGEVYVRWLEGEASLATYRLYGPDGAEVGLQAAGSNARFALPHAGEYTLVLFGETSGSYDYKLRAQLTGSLAPAAYTLGTTAAGALDVPGERDRYTFTGAAGQRVVFDALTVADGSYLLGRLLDPAGTPVPGFDGFNLAYDGAPVTLPAAGTYTLEVYGYDADTGAYSFRLIDPAAAPAQALTLGAAATNSGSAPTGREAEVFRFAGTAGERLQVDWKSGFSYYGYYYLYGPDNEPLGSQQYGLGQAFDLPATGQYLLVFQTAYTSSYSFGFAATKPSTTAGTGNPLSAAGVSGTISAPGEVVTYTFAGAVGQGLVFDGLAGDYRIRYRLTGPAGVDLTPAYLDSLTNDSGPITLPVAGTYTVAVSAEGVVTGPFAFRLVDRAASPAKALTLGTEVSGTMPTGYEADVYRFTAAAGQRVFLDWLTVGSGGSWYVYGPAGDLVTNEFGGLFAGGFGADGEAVLPVAGSYTLVLGAYGGSSYTYSLKLSAAVTTTAALALGSTVTGSLDAPGENDEYTFTGAVGQTLVYDGISGGTSVFATLFDPAGNAVGVYGDYFNPLQRDRGPFTLTLPGTYTLRVFGFYDATGAYSFRLLDRAAAPALSLAADTEVTLAENTMAVYRLTGVAGAQFYAESLGGTATGYYTLFNPENQAVWGNDLSGDLWPVLQADGPYTLVVWGNAGGTFKFRANLPGGTTTALTLGATVTGALDNPGEVDRYTFTGAPGQRIVFDGRSGAAGLVVQLVSPTGYELPGLSGVATGADGVPYALAEAGTYTLKVFGSGAATGAYSFRLVDPAAAPDVLPALFFTITAAPADAANPTSVKYATADGTAAGGVNPAVAGTDYQARSGTAYLEPGQAAETVRVNVLKNPALSGKVRFFVNLSDASANATIGDAQGVGTVEGAAPTAVSLAFGTQPADVVAGEAMAAVTVRVLDANGTLDTSYAGAVTVALAVGPVTATLGGTLTVNAVAGVATFTDLTLDRAGAGYKLDATAAGLTGATSTTFKVTPAAASKVAFTRGPSAVTAGATISPSVRVAIQDRFGNTVTTSTAAVVVALSDGTPLFGTTTVNAVDGVATFADLSVRKAGSYTLSATRGTLAAATSGGFTVSAAAASKLAFGQGPSGVGVGTPIAPAVTVAVQDQYGNTVTASTAKVTIARAGGPGALTGTTQVDAVNGVATFDNLRLDAAGSYTIEATATGLTKVTSDPFEVTAPAATDVRVVSATLNGTSGLTVRYSVVGAAATAFDLGFYRSADGTYDAADDKLFTAAVAAAADLAVGEHTLTFTVGTGAGQVPLPGLGLVADPDADYSLLAVADPANALAEDDADPTAEDNTALLAGAYTAAGKPVFVHGTAGADGVTVRVNGLNLEVVVNADTFAYPLKTTPSVRVRTGAGDDTVSAVGVAKAVAAWGGAGADAFTGGSGNDRFDGGAGADTVLAAGDKSFTLTNGKLTGLGTDALAGVERAVLTGGAGANTFALSGWTGAAAVDGLGGADTLVGPAGGGTWQLTGAGAGNLNAGGVAFAGVENITGGAGADVFEVGEAAAFAAVNGGLQPKGAFDVLSYAGRTKAVAVDLGAKTAPGVGAFTGFESLAGGSAADTLTGPAAGATWAVTGVDAGKVGTVAFVGFENLQGGVGNDKFTLAGPDAGVSGGVDGGGGVDTLTGPATTADWLVSQARGGTLSWAGRSVAFAGVENLTGGAGVDTFRLTAADAGLAAVNAGRQPKGEFDVLSYATRAAAVVVDLGARTAPGVGLLSGVESLVGGTGSDTVVGNDKANGFTLSGANAGKAGKVAFERFEALRGGAGNDKLTVLVGGSLAGGFDGRGGVDTVVGPNQANAWALTGSQAGTLNGTDVAFQGVENLTGGSGNDAFAVGTAAAGFGAVNGGKQPKGGADVLSYAAWATAVTVDLGAGPSTAAADVVGFESLVGGSAGDTLAGPDAKTTWAVTGADAGKVGAAAYAGFENLTGGALDDTFKVSPAGSVSGTVNGGGGVDALDYALFLSGVAVDLGAGTATAVGGAVSGVEDVIGGAGADALTGDGLSNRLVGGAGDDTVQGGDGADVLLGGAGNDVLRGEAGADVLVGGVGADLLFGGVGSNLLIGGTTSFDANVAALTAIRAEWSGGSSYADRVKHLRGTLAGGLNGTFLLTPTTVKDDKGAADQLDGAAGVLDWFFRSSPDAVSNGGVAGLEPGEEVN